MIRMVEMSVRLGIKSRGNRELGTKKGRACRASLKQERQATPRARVVFRPDSAAAKGPYGPHQPAFFPTSLHGGARAGVPLKAFIGAPLRPSGFGAASWFAQPKLRSSEGWRPGLDLNQDK